MQKRASKEQEGYVTVFEALPTSPEVIIYRDRQSILLPFCEDFPKLHFHTRYELGVCESGEGLFIADGEFASVTQGDLIFIPPGKRHYSRSLHPDEPCMFRFVYISADSLEELLSAFAKIPREEIKRISYMIPTALRNLKESAHDSLIRAIFDPSFRNVYSDYAAVLRLCTMLLESVRDDSYPLSICPRYDTSTAVRLAEYLSLHYTENETSQSLSDRFHLSESQLRRSFASVYGMPPIAFRNELRLRAGEELLLGTNLPVSVISNRIGFASPTDFYRMLKKYRGTSPSTLRAEQKKQ